MLPVAPPLARSERELGQSLSEQFIDQDFGQKADFEIEIDGHTIGIHKAMVQISDCTFLKRIVDGGWRESTENRVTIHDQDSSLVLRALFYLYDGVYIVHLDDTVHPFNSTGISDQWARNGQQDALFDRPVTLRRYNLHANMFALAIMWDMPSLQKESARQFQQLLISNSFMTFNMMGIPLDDVLELVRFIYSSTPTSERRLRDVVLLAVLVWKANHEELNRFYRTLANGIEDLLELDVDIATSFVTTHETQSYNCDHCGRAARIKVSQLIRVCEHNSRQECEQGGCLNGILYGKACTGCKKVDVLRSSELQY